MEKLIITEDMVNRAANGYITKYGEEIKVEEISMSDIRGGYPRDGIVLTSHKID